jgi:predicted CopG family antitoxin
MLRPHGRSLIKTLVRTQGHWSLLKTGAIQLALFDSRCKMYTYNVLRTTMHKKMTITLDEAVYEGLWRTIGKRKMSQFIEDLLRPHVLGNSLDEGYKAMAQDQARETEAMEWTNALAKDMSNETR